MGVAFYLELENPSWAGTSASIVCQPVLGASLRKGVFRLIGTVVGAVVNGRPRLSHGGDLFFGDRQSQSGWRRACSLPAGRAFSRRRKA